LYHIKFNDSLSVAIKYLSEFSSIACPDATKYFSLKDVAGITSLVIMNCDIDRKKIQQELLAKPSLNALLDEFPSAKEMLVHFVKCEYKEMIKCQDLISKSLKFHMIIGRHLETYKMNIFRKAIVQYLHPFSRVKISTISDNLGITNIDGFVQKLCREGSLPCKIDNFNKVVIASQNKEMMDDYKKLIADNQKFINESYLTYWNYMYKSRKLRYSMMDERKLFGDEMMMRGGDEYEMMMDDL